MKKRGFGKGRWNGVGGKLEPNETIEQALVRECQEEIDVTPLEYQKVAIVDFLPFDHSLDNTVHIFIASRWYGKPSESEEMAPKWFNHQDIPYDDMWQDDIIWLPLLLRGKKVTATFSFDEDDSIRSARLDVLESIES